MLESVQEFFRNLNIKIKLHYRLIILILCIGYIIMFLYLEYEDQQEDDEQYLELFRKDTEFFNKLYSMDPKARERYLKVVRKILDEKDTTNAKKVKVLKKMKDTALFSGITELLLGGGGLFSFFSSSAKSALTVGMMGSFT